MRRFTSSWSNTFRKLGFRAAKKKSRWQAPRRLGMESLEQRIVFSTDMIFDGQTPTVNDPCGCGCSPILLTGGDGASTGAGKMQYASSSDPVASLQFHWVGGLGEFNGNDYMRSDVTIGTDSFQVYWQGGLGTPYDFSSASLSIQPDENLNTGVYEWNVYTDVYLEGDSVHGRSDDGPYILNDGNTQYFVHVVNRTSSAFGDGWSLPGLDQLIIQDGTGGKPEGVALLQSNDALIWFGGSTPNEDELHTDYTREDNPYNFSTLQKLDSVNTYTLTDPDGTVHNFDSSGKLTSVVDRNGNAINTYFYNMDGQVDFITDVAGHGTKFEYTDNRISSITDFCLPDDDLVSPRGMTAGSQVTNYTYTVVSDKVVQMQMTEPDPDGAGPLSSPVTTYNYNETGKLASVIDPRGLETDVTYDNVGLVDQIVQRCGGTIDVTTLESQSSGSFDDEESTPPRFVQYRAATSLGYALPESGYEVQNIYGNKTEIVRGEFGNILSQKDADGNVTSYTYYGSNGLLGTVAPPDPDVDGPLNDVTTAFVYYPDGQTDGITHPSGVEHWEYGAKGQINLYRDSDGNTTTYELDDYGNANSMTQEMDVGGDLVTHYTYTDEDDHTLIGLVETIEDPNGDTTHYTYYTATEGHEGLVKTITYAEDTDDQVTEYYDYDNRDRLSSMTDGNGNTTHYVYDNLDRLIQRIDPDPDYGGDLKNPVWNYTYDAIGNQTHVIDPMGNDTEYVYDVRDRVETTIQHTVAVAPPVAEWKFDEATGTAAADSSGYDHTGTVTGTDTDNWVAGHDGNAFAFDGTTEIDADGLMGESPNVSIAAWANLTTADSNGSNLISIGNDFFIWMDITGYTGAVMYNGTTWESAAIPRTFAGEGWHFFAATFDNTNDSLKFYVDGQLVQTHTTAGPIDYSHQGTNTVIGRNGDGADGWGIFDFTGDIDDVGIYDYTLSADQIAKLYGSTQPQVALWHLDEEAVDADAKDSSGNGLTLTNNNSVSYATGDLHNAASFDGTNSRSLSQSSITLAGSTSFSVWFNPATLDTSNNENDVANILSKASWGGDLNGDFRICQVDNEIQAGVLTSAGDKILHYVMPVADQWYHVAVVYDAEAETVSMYVNGTLVDSGSRSGTFSNNAHALVMGAFPGNEAQTEFNGLIDEAGIYNYALTANQVAQLYNPGSVTQTDYDCNGNLVKVTDPLNNATHYVYDDLNRLKERIDPDPDGDGELESPHTLYTYNSLGWLTSTTDPDENATFYQYDAMGRPTKQIQVTGSGLTGEYRENGDALLHTRTDDNVDFSSSADFAGYSDLGDGFKATWTGAIYLDFSGDPTGDVTFYLDSTDSSELFIDGVNTEDNSGSGPDLIGNTVSLTAGWHLLTIKLQDGVSDDPSSGITASYKIGDGVKDVIPVDILGTVQITTTTYDNDGRSTYVIGADNLGTAYIYDNADRITSASDVSYDGTTYSAVGPATVYTYNGNGQMVSMTNAEGDATFYQHDAVGRQTAEIKIGQQGLTGEYRDADGTLLHRRIDDTVDFEADEDFAGYNDLPAGFSATWTGVISLDEAHTTTFYLDSTDKSSLYIDDQLVVTNADDFGTIALTAGWHSLKIVFKDQSDELDSGMTVTCDLDDGNGVVTLPTELLSTQATTFTYDDAGNRTSLTDPDGNTTTWTYDNLNRVTSESVVVDAETLTRSYQYDNDSRLTSETDRDGRVTTYDYDTLNRRTAEKWFDDDADTTPNRTISYEYDAASNLTEVSDPDATYDYGYDNLNRVIGVTQNIAGLDAPIHFDKTYDANSQVTSVASTIDETGDYLNSYSYDPLGRLTSLIQTSQDGGNDVLDKRLDFTYNAGNQLASIQRYANTMKEDQLTSTGYEYDSGRLSVITHYNVGYMEQFGYSYDGDNRVNFANNYSSFHDGIETSYTFDTHTGQLTGADNIPGTLDDESYEYDDNGDRVNANDVESVPGAYNRIQSDDTYTYEYDNEGNLIYRWETNSPGDRTYYTWDNRNRLIHVSEYDGDHELEIVDYVYDAFNQLIAERTNEPFSEGESSAVFVHDGGQVVLQFDKAGTGDLVASDLTHRYLWGQAVDQLLTDENVVSLEDAGDNETLWALTDRQGSITDMVDNNGVERLHRAFDSYGNNVAETHFDSGGDSVSYYETGYLDEAFAYTGRLFDKETGLQNNLNRWYAPTIGRWLSEDPIGFAAGDANLYRYVGNSPLNGIDPAGLIDPRQGWPVGQDGKRHPWGWKPPAPAAPKPCPEMKAASPVYTRWQKEKFAEFEKFRKLAGWYRSGETTPAQNQEVRKMAEDLMAPGPSHGDVCDQIRGDDSQFIKLIIQLGNYIENSPYPPPEGFMFEEKQRMLNGIGSGLAPAPFNYPQPPPSNPIGGP
jgi:RHS repeat-associated protein